MIKLKKILTESYKDVELSTSLFERYTIPSKLIFRAENNESSDFFIKEIDYIRVSPGSGQNLYNLLLSNLPSWDDYPTRNKSHICSTDNKAVSSYGNNTYIVFPKKLTSIGVCSKDDLWASMPMLEGRPLVSFDYVFTAAIKDYLKGDYNKSIQQNYTELETLCKSDGFSEYMSGKDVYFTSKHWYECRTISDYMKLWNKNVYDILNEYVLNPYRNKFKLVYPNNIPEDAVNNEVWFENDALYVNVSKIDLLEPYISKEQMYLFKQKQND